MNRPTPLVRLALATALALGAPGLLLANGTTRVSVTYDHPENFTETKEVKAFAPARAGNDYLEELKRYLVDRADKMLPSGEQLQVVITDVDRAGSFEPWRGPRLNDVRIIKDIYPPRINLHFRLLDASGKVIREGDRTLRDPGFMSGVGTHTSTDGLRYEKNLIDRWLWQGPDKL